MPILGAIDLDLNTWAVALTICAAVGGVGVWRWSRDRTVSLRDVDREHRTRIREQARISKTLTELMEELESAATRINAQLDARFAGLERLIHDADAKLAMINRFRGERAKSATDEADESRAREAPPEATEEFLCVAPQRHPLDAAADAAERVVASRTTPRDTIVLPAGQAEILAAARAGSTSVQIAEQSRRPIGEVELILELARFRAVPRVERDRR